MEEYHSWTDHKLYVQVHMLPLTTSFKVVVPALWAWEPFYLKQILGVKDSTVLRLETFTTNGNTTFRLTIQPSTPDIVLKQFDYLVKSLISASRSMRTLSKERHGQKRIDVV